MYIVINAGTASEPKLSRHVLDSKKIPLPEAQLENADTYSCPIQLSRPADLANLKLLIAIEGLRSHMIAKAHPNPLVPEVEATLALNESVPDLSWTKSIMNPAIMHKLWLRRMALPNPEPKTLNHLQRQRVTIWGYTLATLKVVWVPAIP